MLFLNGHGFVARGEFGICVKYISEDCSEKQIGSQEGENEREKKRVRLLRRRVFLLQVRLKRGLLFCCECSTFLVTAFKRRLEANIVE